MTREEVQSKVANIIDDQFGARSFALTGAKNLQEALSCTSLEIVSFQMAVEEAFSLKFATGASDRGPIDEHWDAAKGIDDLVELVLKFRC